MTKTKSQSKSPQQLKNLTHDSMPASVGLVKEVRDELRAEIRSVEHGLNSKLETVITSAHRIQVIVEEQRSENRIVLDGLKTVLERQERCETDIALLKQRVRL